MRLDKYLKVSRLIKRRTVANEACDNGRISVNGRVVKAGYDVKVGDKIEISMGARTVTVEVLQVAETVRKDDAPETVKNRLKVFHAETEPLKDFYKKLGNLKLVEGNQPIENATRDILAALGE